MIAGNPKVYAQLVTLLSPFTRVITDAPAPGASHEVPHEVTPEAALAATLSDESGAPAAPAPAVAKKPPVRIRKEAAAPAAAPAPRRGGSSSR